MTALSRPFRRLTSRRAADVAPGKPVAPVAALPTNEAGAAIDIPESDWALLPDVPEGRDSVNIDPDTERALQDAGYIIGQLQRVIFYEPGVKETNWSVTGPVLDTEGQVRRWVYLHYFKAGQPSINWRHFTRDRQSASSGKKSTTSSCLVHLNFRASTAGISCCVRERPMTVRPAALGPAQSWPASMPMEKSARGKPGSRKASSAACLKAA